MYKMLCTLTALAERMTKESASVKASRDKRKAEQKVSNELLAEGDINSSEEDSELEDNRINQEIYAACDPPIITMELVGKTSALMDTLDPMDPNIVAKVCQASSPKTRSVTLLRTGTVLSDGFGESVVTKTNTTPLFKSPTPMSV